MVEIDKIKIGQKVIWLGSERVTSYGQREVSAVILSFTPSGRIKIELDTPIGKLIKFVSSRSLDYDPKDV